MSSVPTEEWLSTLAAQYERYPYPNRDPEAEPAQHNRTMANNLAAIAHYLNGGRPMHGQGFRALVAGGGTGDATVHLASQLAVEDPDAEILHIDLSNASLAIAQKRVEGQGLKNVRFHQFNLLDLKPEHYGEFDYINCSGVLHHLPDPIEGLRRLRGVLKPHGGLSVMLYGTYGRIGVYQVQDIMRRLRAHDEDDLETAAQLARELLKSLPPSNWQVRRAGGVPDRNSSTEEIVDKYLHPHDRPFTVPEIFDALDAAELTFAGFRHPLWYDPAAVLPEDTFGGRLRKMSVPERAALGEILHGMYHSRHVFYASRRMSAPVPPDPSDWLNVPVWIGQELSAGESRIMFGGPIPSWISGEALALLRGIDGTRSVRDLCQLFVESTLFGSEEDFRTSWSRVYRLLNGRGLLMLRRAGCPDGAGHP